MQKKKNQTIKKNYIDFCAHQLQHVFHCLGNFFLCRHWHGGNFHCTLKANQIDCLAEFRCATLFLKKKSNQNQYILLLLFKIKIKIKSRSKI